MKSYAQIKGHPIHPILVGFPITLFIATFVTDAWSIIQNLPGWWAAGWYLEIAGIVCGLVAAIPGAIDYFMTLPPRSSAKKRGTQHALVNISMIIVFAIALVLRDNTNVPFYVPIILEGIGIILIGIAGWMGGTLVYRNQIGVYNRYANSGNWNELRIDKLTSATEVATNLELKQNQMKLIIAHNKRIVLAKTEDGYVAFDDRCTHKGGSLAGGNIMCGTVQCPWHGSQFDVRTGNIKAGPAHEAIKTYTVTERNGKLYLNI
jgi:nitrite reductase/ring-hydroxylating ferredoxin subunit/uncharacterized membrane protein